jgi:hypothetical protein
MMSSTAWECPVLSPALLLSVSSVALCCYVAGHCSGTQQAAHNAGIMLQFATYLTELPTQSC